MMLLKATTGAILVAADIGPFSVLVMTLMMKGGNARLEAPL